MNFFISRIALTIDISLLLKELQLMNVPRMDIYFYRKEIINGKFMKGKEPYYPICWIDNVLILVSFLSFLIQNSMVAFLS